MGDEIKLAANNAAQKVATEDSSLYLSKLLASCHKEVSLAITLISVRSLRRLSTGTGGRHPIQAAAVCATTPRPRVPASPHRLFIALEVTWVQVYGNYSKVKKYAKLFRKWYIKDKLGDCEARLVTWLNHIWNFVKENSVRNFPTSVPSAIHAHPPMHAVASRRPSLIRHNTPRRLWHSSHSLGVRCGLYPRTASHWRPLPPASAQAVLSLLSCPYEAFCRTCAPTHMAAPSQTISGITYTTHMQITPPPASSLCLSCIQSRTR